MNAAETKKLLSSTKEHEGYCEHVYVDTRGNRTIGYGLNLEAGLPEDEAAAILAIRLKNCEIRLLDTYRWFYELPDARKRSLIEMAFQLGSISGFPKMVRALRAGKWERAADEMLDSRWARQTPVRSEHCARLMREG